MVSKTHMVKHLINKIKQKSNSDCVLKLCVTFFLFFYPPPTTLLKSATLLTLKIQDGCGRDGKGESGIPNR